MTNQTWTKKYEPKKSSDVIGQSKPITSLKEFILNYKHQKKKAALIYGPPGSGKTSSVYAVGNELNLEVLELNASDVRKKDAVNSILSAASQQKSLFYKGKIILVDEVDGMSGTKDRGGLQEVLRLIEISSFPMILILENPYDQKFSALRKKTSMIEFKELDYKAVYEVLKKICSAEKIQHEETVLKALARRTGSDVRAAINDLFTLTNDSKKLTKQSLEDLGERNVTDNMNNALLKIFKTLDPKIAITAFDNVNEDFDKIFLWIDQNLPREYTKPEDLYNAYEAVSKADVFNGRIRRNQQWRFLVYINALLSAGIATAKKEKYKTMQEYKPTTRILKLWQAKMKYMKRKAIAEKISAKTHCSTKRAIQDTLPYLQVIFQKNKKMSSEIAQHLDLEKEEIEWLRK